MTRDDIIRMARDAHISHIYSDAALFRFAALVAAAEREACAKVAEEVGDRDTDTHAYDAAAAIRARGEK